jgi:hypothetical protein
MVGVTDGPNASFSGVRLKEKLKIKMNIALNGYNLCISF